jgi:stage III sporulation protein AG
MSRRGRIFLNFSSWRKIRNRIKNLKGTDWLIVLLVGVLLLVVALPTGSSTGSGTSSDASGYAQGTGGTTSSGGAANSSGTAKTGSTKTGGTTNSGGTVNYGGDAEAGDQSIEAELADILSCMEGVGKVKVMITWKGEEGSDVEGVFVVAEGAGNATVCADILSAVQSLFSIEAHKITIAKMSVSEGAN